MCGRGNLTGLFSAPVRISVCSHSLLFFKPSVNTYLLTGRFVILLLHFLAREESLCLIALNQPVLYICLLSVLFLSPGAVPHCGKQ